MRHKYQIKGGHKAHVTPAKFTHSKIKQTGDPIAKISLYEQKL